MAELLIPPRSVLLVEDSHVNQKLMAVMLKNEGCEIILAGDGKQAVDLFKLHTFDLVLMDVQMPVMDGLEATRTIRQYESHSGARTPIIAVTAGMDRDSCIASGMDDYIAKPVRVEVLREILARITCGVR